MLLYSVYTERERERKRDTVRSENVDVIPEFMRLDSNETASVDWKHDNYHNTNECVSTKPNKKKRQKKQNNKRNWRDEEGPAQKRQGAREGHCINDKSNKTKPFQTKAATSYAKRLLHIFTVSASDLTILRQIVCSVCSGAILLAIFFSISNWSLFHHRVFYCFYLTFFFATFAFICIRMAFVVVAPCRMIIY